jgi:hypothetical protein
MQARSGRLEFGPGQGPRAFRAHFRPRFVSADSHGGCWMPIWLCSPPGGGDTRSGGWLAPRMESGVLTTKSSFFLGCRVGSRGCGPGRWGPFWLAGVPVAQGLVGNHARGSDVVASGQHAVAADRSFRRSVSCVDGGRVRRGETLARSGHDGDVRGRRSLLEGVIEASPCPSTCSG